jgi:hypothetical protein
LIHVISLPHEAAALSLVHSSARDLGDAAKAIVESRLGEDSDAKQTLASPPRSRSTPDRD